MLSPFIPATARRIFQALGAAAEDPSAKSLAWGGLSASAAMPEGTALFPRVDVAGYFSERKKTMSEQSKEGAIPTPAPAETTQAVTPSDGPIGIEEFQRIRLITARVIEAERVPKSNKLLRLQVDTGAERRQVVAGIARQYAPEALVGKNVVIVANLKPAKLMGVESNGMVLAATVGETGDPVLLDVPADVPPGSRVK
jgi:methionyl-tRNA synthetase